MGLIQTMAEFAQVFIYYLKNPSLLPALKLILKKFGGAHST